MGNFYSKFLNVSNYDQIKDEYSDIKNIKIREM
jgi:hypothetical protein